MWVGVCGHVMESVDVTNRGLGDFQRSLKVSGRQNVPLHTLVEVTIFPAHRTGILLQYNHSHICIHQNPQNNTPHPEE